jgi:UDP-N-acetylglucosamine--N-acetylmuramyl-(pentapeptide) pyrophosphoryl-undecaprenol N-acetylglucosamine transferase
MNENKKTILLTGGGTMGPVVPLLGVYQEMKKKHKELEFVWLGTKTGPERKTIEDAGIKFIPIFSGKLRRYFSFKNFSDILKIKLAFFQSIYYILKYRPSIMISAGAYVSVPIAWAAWLLRVPVLIHQQDAEIGLANRLMSFFAKKITCTFEKSLDDYGKKAVWVGNSVRQEFVNVKISPREAKQKLNLSQSPPVVLILGGGTGATAINDLIKESLDQLTRFCQILHIAGKGKVSEELKLKSMQNPNYRVFEFLDTFGMIKSFAASNLVVSRCGMSTLTEISYLAKPAILIPMPDTHQEKNANIFVETKAATVLNQNEISTKNLLIMCGN